MADYTPYLNEANSYFRIVDASVNKDKKLGNKVISSISSMILEKYFVTLLMCQGVSVSGHSIKSLITSARNHCELPSELSGIESIDEKMDLCSFNPIQSEEISDEDISTLFSILVVLKNFVYDKIGENTTK